MRALTKQARDLCKHLRTTPRVQPDHGPTHACGTSPHAWTRGIRIVPLGTCFPIHGWISPKTCTNCDIKAVERRQSKRMALYQRPQLYKFAPRDEQHPREASVCEASLVGLLPPFRKPGEATTCALSVAYGLGATPDDDPECARRPRS